MLTTELVPRHDEGGITTLTLNAPNTINALSEAMMAALGSQLDRIVTDDAVRVVVIRGAGAHFCAGHNLKEMAARRSDADGGLGYFRALFQTCSEVMLRITQLPQPVIAEVSGIATAAGCQLVAACDLAVASNDARFATSGVNIGLFCSTPLVALSRTVARKHAMEMLLTGGFIDAQQAVGMGLVNRAVPGDELADATRQLAMDIASKTPAAIKVGKRLFYEQATLSMEEAYAMAGEVMACNMMADDTAAGIDAFINKRPMPEWRGK